ncbi:MAG: hypothetical protein LLG00_04635 [Planctomycetaceae bacterium]|nr:hypothetical protein [Planctomycetaceae bacterium]
MAWLLAAVLAVAFLPWVACHEQLPPRLPADGPATLPASPLPPTIPHAGLVGRRVLLVHSYHEGYPWVDTVTEGVRSSLRGTGIDLCIFYMDAKRHTDEAWKIDAGRRARRQLEEYRPDVVIAADDDAQQYFAAFYVNTRLPIVFTGVDADPSRYGYPAANVTGIIERPHFKQSLALAARLWPIKRIAVLSCHDSTSVLALGFMRQERLGVEVDEWYMADDFDQWKKVIARLNRSVDAIVIRSYQALKRPGSRDNVNPAEVAAWTSRHVTIPTIAFHDFEIRDGLLVGVVKCGQEYGAKAADYAIRILRGTPAGSLPIVKPQRGIPMISRGAAARLGIRCEEKTPHDAIFVSND